MDLAQRDEYLILMQSFFAHEVRPRFESDWPVTQTAYERLGTDDVELIERRVGDVYGDTEQQALQRWKDASFPHYRREILRYGCSVTDPCVDWDGTVAMLRAAREALRADVAAWRRNADV